jgi:hypothetical protein
LISQCGVRYERNRGAEACGEETTNRGAEERTCLAHTHHPLHLSGALSLVGGVSNDGEPRLLPDLEGNAGDESPEEELPD